MIYKNKPECKTISTWVPIETHDTLMNMAESRTKRYGQWWSLSKLVRELLVNIAETENQKAKMTDVYLRAMEDHHGRA